MRVTFERPDIELLAKEHMLVDMHYHSRHSHDSGTSIQHIIDRAKKLGVYVALTDHNSIQGVLAARKIEPGRVKPGVEITTKENKDVLVYFYNVRDLKDFFTTYVQPRMKEKSSLRGARTDIAVQALLRELKRWRCVVALAHPFALGGKRSHKLFAGRMQHIDAVETVNQALPHMQNLSAVGLAVQHEKAFVGGSDGHILRMLGTAFTYSKAKTWAQFLDNIKARDVNVIGEQQKLRHHVLNMSRILKEKARVINNRRIKKERH